MLPEGVGRWKGRPTYELRLTPETGEMDEGVAFVAPGADDHGAWRTKYANDDTMIDSRLAFFQWKGAVVLTLGMEVLEGSGRPGQSRLRVCSTTLVHMLPPATV